MVDMGEHQRVRESLTFSRSRPPSSSSAVERITGRTVRSFASATDPAQSTVIEAFIFEPEQ
jgi:hypothetical protein